MLETPVEIHGMPYLEAEDGVLKRPVKLVWRTSNTVMGMKRITIVAPKTLWIRLTVDRCPPFGHRGAAKQTVRK